MRGRVSCENGKLRAGSIDAVELRAIMTRSEDAEPVQNSTHSPLWLAQVESLPPSLHLFISLFFQL